MQEGLPKSRAGLLHPRSCPSAQLAPAKPRVESFHFLAGNKLKQLLKLLAFPSMRHSVLGLDMLICQHLTVKLSLPLMQTIWIRCLKKGTRKKKKKDFTAKRTLQRRLLPIFLNCGSFPYIYQPSLMVIYGLQQGSKTL